MEMEKSGELHPSPSRIRELSHERIDRRIWCANAYGRELMEVGFEPPLTGLKIFDPWSDFNISGQFICESFGLMSPGMPVTGSKIALNFTRVTIEGEPAQTTQLFTTMIATAFFEKDIDKILDAGEVRSIRRAKSTRSSAKCGNRIASIRGLEEGPRADRSRNIRAARARCAIKTVMS